MRKRVEAYLKDNYSFGLVVAFLSLQLIARYLIVSIPLVWNVLLISRSWMWGRALIHFLTLYLPSTYIQKHRKKAKLNLSGFFAIFLFIDFICALIIGVRYISQIFFIYFVVKDKELKMVKDKELKIRKNHYFYYFLFTVALHAVDTQILTGPFVRAFFDVTGVIALITYLRKKNLKVENKNTVPNRS